MNTNDLYLEYARVIQMCKNTELEDTPWVCVRWRKEDDQDWRYFSGGHPVFGFFKFGCIVESAVAVLEGKPVWVGDKVFIRNNKYPDVNWKLFDYWKNDIATLSKDWTWTQPTPKRTFAISGGGQISGYKSGDLPCPVNDPVDGLMFNIHGNSFYFKTMGDRDSIIREFSRILTEARDKA